MPVSHASTVGANAYALCLQLCYYVCLPACVCKNVINVAQLCSAANAVATQDAEAANKAK